MADDLPPTRMQRLAIIIDSVTRVHGVTLDEIKGTSRAAYLVDARRDAACRLRAAGFTITRIAQILERDNSTIDYYVYGKRKATKRADARAAAMLFSVPEVTRETIKAVAEAEGVSIRTIVAEWLTERATYEHDARKRAAA